MARYYDARLTYEGTARFVDAALRRDDSLFTPGRAIWTIRLLDELDERFIQRPDMRTDVGFETKLRDQLAGASPDALPNRTGSGPAGSQTRRPTTDDPPAVAACSRAREFRGRKGPCPILALPALSGQGRPTDHPSSPGLPAQELAPLFDESIEKKRRKISPATEKNYRCALDHFCCWFDCVGLPRTVRSFAVEQLKAYADYLASRPALPGKRGLDGAMLSNYSPESHLRPLRPFSIGGCTHTPPGPTGTGYPRDTSLGILCSHLLA